jgi:hypothetical protein
VSCEITPVDIDLVVVEGLKDVADGDLDAVGGITAKRSPRSTKFVRPGFSRSAPMMKRRHDE